MDEKTQRYIQRIDQIMLTPRRKAIQGRPSKSPITCKPSNLDKYIKYELSTKIIQNIINKNHIQLANSFFNAIRNTEFRQKEKIYKFIAIEKKQKRELKVDIAISGKIMLSVLKELTKRRYVGFVNSLLEYSRLISNMPTPSNLPKNAKKRSSRESTGYGVLVRTSTIAERENYRIVSEWIDDSSALQENLNLKKQGQETHKIATKTIFKTLDIKIQNCYLLSFYKIQLFISGIKQSAMISEEKNTEKQQASIKNKNIYQKIKLINDLARFENKFISSIFTILKKHYNRCLYHNAQVTLFFEILKGINTKHRLKHFHNFFNAIQLKLIDSKNETLKLNSSIKPNKKLTSSLIKSDASQVQAFNPLLKLNFYSFVDKIFKFILIVSKMLIPIREAFIKIDHYASFSYRLEQSLKVAPKRFLLDAFNQIKHSTIVEQSDCDEDSSRGQKLYQFLIASINERLIDGFIHIKIAADSRKLKVKILPAKDNIVEKTKQFIIDRQQHQSLSIQSWNEFKSSLLSPTQKITRNQGRMIFQI